MMKTGKRIDNKDFDADDPTVTMEFAADDKYGRVLQKDIDKMTGGMNKVKEYKADLNSFNTMTIFAAPDKKVKGGSEEGEDS